MKINNYGLDAHLADKLFRVICEELSEREGPDVGLSVLPNQLSFVDPRFTSPVLSNPLLGLSAFVMYGLEAELNLIMVEQELPKGGDLNLSLYRHGNQPEIIHLFACKNLNAGHTTLAAKRLFEFFYSKFFSHHQHYSGVNSIRLPSVTDATKSMFSDLASRQSLEMHSIDFLG